MKLALIILLSVAGALCSAYGQLDQPEAATTAAYGQPLSSGKPLGSSVKINHYRTPTYEITAGIQDQKTVYLIYKKTTGASWSDDEIKSVLQGHRIGHDNWNWSKKLITGKHGPAVHAGKARNIDAAEEWHIFAHDDYSAEYLPEQATLLIWDATSGQDAGAILQQNEF